MTRTATLVLRSLILAAALAAASSFSASFSLWAAEAPKEAPKPATPPPKAPTPAQIDRNGVLILIRSTLIALDQANKTGNYTVLRDIGAPGWYQGNTDARLAEIFVGLRKDNVDLSGVAVLEPQLSMLPQIEANGLMHMAGFFPSVPKQVNFELLYAPVNRQWLLFGVAVNLGQAGPVAPGPAASSTPPPPSSSPPPSSTAPKGKPPPPPLSLRGSPGNTSSTAGNTSGQAHP